MVVICTDCRKLESVPDNVPIRELTSTCCGAYVRQFVFRRENPAESASRVKRGSTP